MAGRSVVTYGHIEQGKVAWIARKAHATYLTLYEPCVTDGAEDWGDRGDRVVKRGFRAL